MAMELHVGAPASAAIEEQVAFMRRAEAMGFSGVGVADDARYGDAFDALSAGAEVTSKVWLYPAVANPVSRTPAQLATLTRSLFARAPGRTKLAIGAGDAALEGSGRRPATLRELKSAVVDIRGRLGEGSTKLLPPPVLLAASGVKTLEAAGETADGVLVTSGLSWKAREAVTEAVAQGAIRAGRRSRDIPITYYALVSIDEDREKAIERSRSWVHFLLGRGMFKLSLRAIGLPAPQFPTPESIPTAFLHRLVSEFALAGTPQEVAARVVRLSADGVPALFCMLPGGLKQHVEGLDRLAKHVLPVAG